MKEQTPRHWASGRPPSVYSQTRKAALTSPTSYPTFLQAIVAALRKQGVEPDQVLAESLAGWTQRNPQIQELGDAGQRLEAARRLLFSGLDATPVERTDDGFQFSLGTCPLGPLSLEYSDLCSLARGLIGSLIGQEVEQSEWIGRGDPRCTFHVRAEDAGLTSVQKEPTGT